MIRSLQHLEGNDWRSILDSSHPLVLYFNEPHRSGISPRQAADIWHSQVLSLRHDKGKRIAGPACTNDDEGKQWLVVFMELVIDAPPDYLAVHYYGPDAQVARDYIEALHHRFSKIPVMVTEIACTSREPRIVIDFTARLANWMDTTPWIFEYAFFGCTRHVADDFVSPAAQLMSPDGSLTDLMERLMKPGTLSRV